MPDETVEWGVDMGFALCVRDEDTARRWVRSYVDHPEALEPGDPMPVLVRRTITTSPWLPVELDPT